MSVLKNPWFLPFLLSPLGLLIPVAPRSGPLLVLLLGIAGIIHYIRHRPPLDWLKTKPMAALAAWLVYLLLTGFWSEVPERSFEQAFRLTLLAFFGLACFASPPLALQRPCFRSCGDWVGLSGLLSFPAASCRPCLLYSYSPCQLH